MYFYKCLIIVLKLSTGNVCFIVYVYIFIHMGNICVIVIGYCLVCEVYKEW